MKEIEEIEKIIEATKTKIQLQKAKNQKLRNTLNEIEMNKSNSMKEVQRLKDVNISLENNIKETKQEIQEENGKQEMENLLNDLGGMFK